MSAVKSWQVPDAESGHKKCISPAITQVGRWIITPADPVVGLVIRLIQSVSCVHCQEPTVFVLPVRDDSAKLAA